MIERIMDIIARNAGAFFPVAALVAFALGVFLPGEAPDAVLRLAPYLFAVAGIAMLVASFFRSARDRGGEWPTLATLSLFYLFVGAALLIATASLAQIAALSPWIAANLVPESLIRGFRFAVCTLIFTAGWAFQFGLSRDWLGRETNPWPFPAFHRAVSSKIRTLLTRK
jgi:hypothetical protein